MSFFVFASVFVSVLRVSACARSVSLGVREGSGCGVWLPVWTPMIYELFFFALARPKIHVTVHFAGNANCTVCTTDIVSNCTACSVRTLHTSVPHLLPVLYSCIITHFYLFYCSLRCGSSSYCTRTLYVVVLVLLVMYVMARIFFAGMVCYLLTAALCG